MNHSPEPIWDLPVRLFHWSLPLLVFGAWICAEFDWMQAHAWCGYTLLVLIGWRIAWGFAGSTHSRFAGFLRSPRAAWRHLREAGAPVEGHNPAGGWSVMAMLALLLAQPLTGLFNEDDVSFAGPLAHLGGGRYTGTAGAWHEWNFNLLMMLVGLHVVIVLLHLRRGENLIRPMIDGGRASKPVVTRPTWLAVLILLALAAGLWLALSQVPRPQVFL